MSSPVPNHTPLPPPAEAQQTQTAPSPARSVNQAAKAGVDVQVTTFERVRKRRSTSADGNEKSPRRTRQKITPPHVTESNEEEEQAEEDRANLHALATLAHANPPPPTTTTREPAVAGPRTIVDKHPPPSIAHYEPHGGEIVSHAVTMDLGGGVDGSESGFIGKPDKRGARALTANGCCTRCGTAETPRWRPAIIQDLKYNRVSCNKCFKAAQRRGQEEVWGSVAPPATFQAPVAVTYGPPPPPPPPPSRLVTIHTQTHTQPLVNHSYLRMSSQSPSAVTVATEIEHAESELSKLVELSGIPAVRRDPTSSRLVDELLVSARARCGIPDRYRDQHGGGLIPQ
ncbi:hypothetical protein HDU87_002776 [Geranomyces variabilis]|uniref:GATA-type domain-containing protein n=1 Tax=Geranomyces variabilis TaxID=109894 RepID=A0AAD5TKX1_9FUNG|nr:hypothetical protein HDU87_002776 [Geranomyces variabilis]